MHSDVTYFLHWFLQNSVIFQASHDTMVSKDMAHICENWWRIQILYAFMLFELQNIVHLNEIRMNLGFRFLQP
jgi:hypothetical protein